MSIRTHIKLIETAERHLLTEGAIPVISPQEARDRNMFGPVYHGTSNIQTILDTGFDVARSVPKGVGMQGFREVGIGDLANGYTFEPYQIGGDTPPPVHHLGFGVYFTTVRAIAKQFNGGTEKGLKEFWIDSQNVEEINFGSPNTMMRWWFQNGYDPKDGILKSRDHQDWVRATWNLTNTLKSQFDAVWYKGKGMGRRVLDGDQICVYDPSLIYVVDASLATGLQVGAKVVHSQQTPKWRDRNDVYVDDLGQHPNDDPRFAGWRGYFRSVNHDGTEQPRDHKHNYPIHKIPPAGMVGTIMAIRGGPSIGPDAGKPHYDVKWTKGGLMHNYTADELAPYEKPARKGR